MNHSIIIPHRNRVRELRQTLWSIINSARILYALHWDSFSPNDPIDFEVLVLHAGDDVERQSITDAIEAATGPSADIYFHESPIRVICDEQHSRVFNKPRLLNRGINAAQGRILSFLDADMIVGQAWMTRTRRELLDTESPPTRLCYRVRQIIGDGPNADKVSQHELILRKLETEEKLGSRDDFVSWMGSYDISKRFPKAAEAYGQPDWTNNPQVRTPVFGNSQWSILRDVLGDMRFDEAFEGAGFEDLDFIDAIWRTVPNYTGKIITDPSASLYHLHHARASVLGSDWCDPKLSLANQARYHRNAGRRRFEQRERNIAKVPE